eukprot:CCRYP_019323-RA/>CCRYP_019323-RA protein AED:0.11 eAED:0.08 QI:0/0/0/1/1/1/4/0/564
MKLCLLILTCHHVIHYAKAALHEYTWTLKSRRPQKKDPTFSPDCYLDRPMLLVNDQFPGPAIEASVGDTVRVTLVNHSPTESVSLHFHGLTMLGQPYVDGTGSVSQCASGPLQTQVYEFVVTDAGTHYWHGHISMERGDGFQGPIVITDPSNEDENALSEMYDEEAVVFLQDWYRLDGNYRRTGLDTNPFIWIGNAQTFLINGGGILPSCLANPTDASCAEDCSLDNYIRTIEVEAGKTYRMRLISATELIGVNFAIQGHTMTVVEVEGTIVEPFEVESLDIMPAQRYSVLVTMDQVPDYYWATTAVRYRNAGPTGYINIKYSGATDANLTLSRPMPSHPIWNDTQPTIDLETQLVTKNVDEYDDSDVLTAEPTSIRRIIIVGTQAQDLTLGLLRWATNNVTNMMSDEPMVLSSYKAVHAQGATSWPDTEIPGHVRVSDKPPNVWDYTQPVQGSVGEYNGDRGLSYIPLIEGEVVEIVLQNARALNGAAEMHAWHLHGHNFYVVGRGFGTFDENTDVASYNLINPVRRDTATLLPLGWTAFRFKANNPGAWSFHCTMTAHALMG